MFTQKEIREQFISFFQSKAHTYIPGCSLIPAGDPTLMFINSGMVQFKDIFLGLKEPKNTKACNSQKCIRLSGKHNDLDEVGYDTYHHTFFEMLGNWSFNDYYKKEAITWAWELLTEVWKLPKDKLYATVYETDDEAFDLWKTATDIGSSKILRCGDKDNFWEMADVGPCGPCSEIHIDVGEKHCTCEGAAKVKCAEPGGGVNQDCPRYIEIWNLVFIQYNRQEDGSLEPLEKVHVDTGMGFERICAVLQKANSNYETDVFSPLIAHLEKLTGKQYDTTTANVSDLNQVAFRVVVDHVRTIAFSIADGVIPSNEGRGYVIRRVLRRAYRYGRELGLSGSFLSTFVSILDESFGDFFSEIREQRDFITKIIKTEEEAFDLTLSKGLILFEKKVSGLKGQVISGRTAFELYDTYGFPLDLTLLLAKERGLSVNEDEFKTALDQQRTTSKKGKKSLGKWDLIPLFKDENGAGKLDTENVGDRQESTEGVLKKIILGGEFVETINEANSNKEQVVLIFDRTCFYGESGGQVGDIGKIFSDEGEFVVEDCQKIEKIFLIYGSLKRGAFSVGKTYCQQYDSMRRNAIRKNHTATHLLHQVLTANLGDHIHQSGSLVNDKKLRFDFNHFEPISTTTLKKIEVEVNEAIAKNYRVTAEEMPMAEAKKKGAKAFFEEKYGDVVRVLSMTRESEGEKSFSTELCGGSHVETTAEIAGIKILSESSSASGIRRIEAITGTELIADYFQRVSLIDESMSLLGVGDESSLVSQLTKLKSASEKMKQSLAKEEGEDTFVALKASKEEIKAGVNFYTLQVADKDPVLLSEQLDRLKNQDQRSVVFLVNLVENKKVTFLVGVGAELLKEYKEYSAGKLVKIVAEHCGGGGGGKPAFAQAGGRDLTKVSDTAGLIREVLK